MGQTINNSQYTLNQDGAQYANPYFLNGFTTISVTASDSDYTINTGITAFPNAVINGNVTVSWVNVSWSALVRAVYRPYISGGTLRFSAHVYSAVSQNVSFEWWALGY